MTIQANYDQMPVLGKYKKRMAELDEDLNSWTPLWKDVVDFVVPRRGRYLQTSSPKHNDGTRRANRVINATSGDALKVLAAGLQGGLTSPSRPWFVLALADEQMMEYAPVKEWLYNVRNLMLAVFARSNFYGCIHDQYMELGSFGVSSMIIEEDTDKVIRCVPLTIGEFRLILDKDFMPAGLYRKFSLTVSQMVEEFGEENLSQSVQTKLKNGKKEERIEIHHAIQKNTQYDGSRKDQRGMKYEGVYWEAKGGDDKVLRRDGYRDIPFVGPRWEVAGRDTYGDAPGIAGLGDNKMLQKMEIDKLEALGKMVKPPMNAPTAMKAKGGTIIAGGVNYLDVQQGQQGFTPVYQTNPDLENIAFEIDRVEKRLRRFFYNDLFLAILNESKTMTATEVAERYEEKLLMLGPVLERLQFELLDVVIDRTYQIMDSLGLIPPPPPELQGQMINVNYISILAQAQKMVGTKAIEQTISFVGNIAAVNPEVTDKIDFDEAVDQYADMTGAPPKIVRSDDAVARIREARAKAQQAQQALETGTQGAQAAKLLSETPLNKGSALDVLMQGAGQ